MKNKKTLVLGATTKPERYAFKAITMLVDKGHSVLAIGQNTGEVAGVTIRTKNIALKNVCLSYIINKTRITMSQLTYTRELEVLILDVLLPTYYRYYREKGIKPGNLEINSELLKQIKTKLRMNH